MKSIYLVVYELPEDNDEAGKLIICEHCYYQTRKEAETSIRDGGYTQRTVLEVKLNDCLKYE